MRHMILAITLVGFALVFIGCSMDAPVRGWVPAIELGKTATNFDYMDSKGKKKPFRTLFGDYTVLMFTKCEKAHTPAEPLLKEILKENEGAFQVRVTGVNIHWTEKGCAGAAMCHMVEEKRGLHSLCDAKGGVRELYGAGDENAIYVVGPDHKVFDAVPEAKADKLRAKLKDAVKALAKEKLEKSSPQAGDVPQG